MLSNSFVSDMRRNLSNMQTIQQQMTTGKVINKPSDDPFKAARIMQLNSDIDANTQYNTNITDMSNWMDTTDTSMGQIGNSLQRVRELLVSAGNGAYGPTEKKAIKDEINSKMGEISQILNTNFDGKYIFGGSRGSAKPVTVIDDTANANGNSKLVYYTGNASAPELTVSTPISLSLGNPEVNNLNTKLNVEVSQGVKVQYNVCATDILQFKNESGTDIDLRDALTKIVNHLDGNNDTGTAVDANANSYLTGTDLQNITDAINNVLKIRSKVGANENMMESAKTRNETQNDNMTKILSETEDIDITQKTMEYSTMQTAYMASLQTSAKVIQPTLLDYLK
jgi:flagellar hook-associated protein 3 FlgL